MDHLIVCNNQQKATKKQQMKSSHKKRQLKAANCLYQKSRASNTQRKHLLEMVRAQQDSLQTKFQSLQSTKVCPSNYCALQNDEATSLHYKMHAVLNYCMKFQRPSRKHGI